MAYVSPSYPEDKTERYALLLRQADALTDGVTHPIPNLANVSALLFSSLPEVNWCGFYLMHEGELLLGPFCGLPACIRIPLGRGVCGTAAAKDCVQRVPDVHAFPGHIACDSASNSELVVPLHAGGRVVSVLDIDSPVLNRFDARDERGLLAIARLLETRCDFAKTAYQL